MFEENYTDDTTWLQTIQVSDTWLSRYVNCYYWALATMMTVGSKVIRPIITVNYMLKYPLK